MAICQMLVCHRPLGPPPATTHLSLRPEALAAGASSNRTAEQPDLEVPSAARPSSRQRPYQAVTRAAARRPATRRNAWDQYVAASARPWRRDCLTAAKAGPSAPGSRMPRADIRRPGITGPRLRVLASPARMGRDRWAPVVPLGEAPSDRGRQRPSRPGCLIPCHPVSPVSPPGRAEDSSHYTFTTVPGTQKALSSIGKGP
jgi:hypothetical protein